MRRFFTLLLIIGFAAISGCSDREVANDATGQDQVLQQKIRLAKCLSEKGWAVYSSLTCPACVVQRAEFGEAYLHLREVECNAHAPNSQVHLCIEKKIRETPTWILEHDGIEIKRLHGYQTIQRFKAEAGCD